MSVELVVTASSPAVMTDPSTSQYNETFGPAVDGFEKLMGQDYKPASFESANAVLVELSKTVQRFDDFRDGNQSLHTWLESYADLLFAVSATLWETTQDVSLTLAHDSLLPFYCILTSISHQPFSPEKTICNAIVVLIEVSLSPKLHARVPVMTIMTIISRPLTKLKRNTSRLWISSIVFNFASNTSTVSMISPSFPT
jgi:hypothetical protein